MAYSALNEIKVKNEEIIVHLTGAKIFKNGKASIEARVVVEVEIDGKPYRFDDVMKVRVTEERS